MERKDQKAVDDWCFSHSNSVGLTSDEYKHLLAPMKEQSLFDFIQAVQVALDETDMVARRCFKAGVNFPHEWIVYTKALRALMSSTSVQPLPKKPIYPSDT